MKLCVKLAINCDVRKEKDQKCGNNSCIGKNEGVFYEANLKINSEGQANGHKPNANRDGNSATRGYFVPVNNGVSNGNVAIDSHCCKTES